MNIHVEIGSDLSATLHAYSFSPAEFAALAATLMAAGISGASFQDRPPDDRGRAGLAVRLAKHAAPRLAEYLGVAFSSEGFTLQGESTMNRYRCVQIDLGGDGPGCVTIRAPNQNAATTKCALIAGQRGWFGGAAHPGSC